MLLARHLGDLDIQGRVLHVALFSIASPTTFSTWPDFDKKENILKYLKCVSQELVMLMKPNMNIFLLITIQVTNV